MTTRYIKSYLSFDESYSTLSPQKLENEAAAEATTSDKTRPQQKGVYKNHSRSENQILPEITHKKISKPISESCAFSLEYLWLEANQLNKEIFVVNCHHFPRFKCSVFMHFAIQRSLTATSLF